MIHFESTARRSCTLWWKIPAGFPVTASLGDPFLPAMLPLCMVLGERLYIDQPVSPVLLNRTDQIQKIYSQWFPDFRIIPVEAPKQDPIRQPGRRTGCFFSGGVDSFFSVLTNDRFEPEDPNRITDLLFVAGFDIPLRKKRLLRRARKNNQTAANALNRSYLEIQTNLRRLSDTILSWSFYHGAAMASAGLLCSPFFHQPVIPSSFSLEQLHPWGSHPDLDPLWSTETLTFIHDDCQISRIQKIVDTICKSEVALKHLRVCWKNYFNQYNCGMCEKCIRTMISLHIGTSALRFPTFPKPLTVKAVEKMTLHSDTALTFARENAKLLPCDNEFDRRIKDALTKAIRDNSIKKSVN